MPKPRRTAAALVATVAATAALLAACGDDDDGGDTAPSTEEAAVTTSAPDATTTTTERARPDGPAADLAEELTGGGGVFIGTATTGADLEAAGYVEAEHVAAGTATSYRAEGELPADGRFRLVEDATADYRTRIVVRRPADAEDFSGTVVVEWFNVSGGLDAAPDFSFLAAEIVRQGHAYVGVSTQHIGIEGGEVAVGAPAGEGIAGRGLKAADPVRYGSLAHPGDAFAYDIYSQVGRALRAGGALGGLEPERLLAVGESQSAFALTTYVNGVHPLAGVYDGYLLHSRGGNPLSLGEPGTGISITSAIVEGQATTIRDDLDVPVLVVQTEGDLPFPLNSIAARQDDTDAVRWWEIAGAAHADRFLVGSVADALDCGGPINDGPQRYVVRAALRALDEWVTDGTAPPESPRIETDETGAVVRDADGIAVGGIRTPAVDVPVATHSGEARPTDQTICILLGATTPFTAEQLARYESPDAYLAAYEEAADAAVDAGFVLPEDRDELLDDAEPGLIAG